MSVESDKLRDLVDNVYPAKISNINSSLSSIQDEEDELNDVKDSLEWQMNEAGDDTISIIESSKADISYTFDDWKVLNITDFKGFDEIVVTNLTFTGSDSFRVDGNQASSFPASIDLLITNTAPTKFNRTVALTTYDVINDWTDVTLNTPGDALNGVPDKVYNLVYEFEGTGWDSDADIIANEAIFQESYAHINDTIGTDGTYGIDDKLSKLQLAKDVLNNDKDKYTDAITYYDKFAT